MYCGAGCSSRGAANAGAVIAGGIDGWGLATEVFADNFPDAHVVNARVEAEDPKRVAEATGPIDLLLASPECTSHSCARGARPRSEESRDRAFEVVRYARAMQPRWIVIENVAHMRAWARYAELHQALINAGYHIAEHLLNAADFGVPQSRQRLFLLCDRDADPPVRLAKRRGPKRSARGILDPVGQWHRSRLDNGKRSPTTIERAMRAVDALGSDERFLIVYYGNDGGRGWQSLSVPLRTITTRDRFGLCEPSEDGLMLRMLQVPELTRAMGFRDELILRRGTRNDRVMLLGNGVCPPVMETVVRTLVGSKSLLPDAEEPSRSTCLQTPLNRPLPGSPTQFSPAHS